MSSGDRNLGCILAILASAGLAWADLSSNPYQPIFERNAFGLKDPPPPQTNAPTPPVQAPPLAKVILTGITSIFGPSSKRALLEITEQEPGKPPNVRKPILREGEREGPVEVLSIDLEKSTVLIRNGTVETNLNFEVQKTAAAAPTGPTPPRGPGAPPSLPPPHAPDMPPTVASQEPNIIPRTPAGTPVDRTGIGLYGGNPSPIATPAAMAVSRPNVYGNANYGGGATFNSGATINSGTTVSSGSTLASANTANSAIDTTRSIRTDTSTENTGVTKNAASTYLEMMINEQRAKNTKRPLPPTPPLPVMFGGQAQNSGNTGN